jgi:tetratricopeptide (TPR) repeat protein
VTRLLDFARLRLAARGLPWIFAVVVFLLGAALYARTLGYDFVDLDDPALVGSPLVQHFSLENLGQIWSQPSPLRATSFSIDRALWDRNPFGFHLHALVLNALNGVLVFWLLARITRRPVALVAALLFAVHSSHIQTAAWISARGELLLTAFVLLSAIAYHAARAGGALRMGPYLASLAAFGLGAASSPSIAGYPIFFLLLDGYLDRSVPGEQRRGFGFHVATKLPYLAVAAPFLWISIPFADFWQLLSTQPLAYLVSRSRAGWSYVFLLLGLASGQPIYEAPGLRGDAIWIAKASVPLVAAVLVWAVALWRRWGEFALALGWLSAGMIVPTFVPLTGFVADRELYAPSIGFCWLLALGIVWVVDVPRRSPIWNSAVACALTIPLLLWYSLVAWRFTPIWRSSETLLAFAASASQGDHAISVAASWLLRQRRIDEAEKFLTSARTLGPESTIDLALVYLAQNRIDDALAAADRARDATREHPELRGEEAQALWVRGLALVKAERLDEAAEAWKQVLERDPTNELARAALAAIDQAKAQRDGAADPAVPAPRAEGAADR